MLIRSGSVALFATASLLVACDREPASPVADAKVELKANNETAAGQPFQARLLELVPDREADTAPAATRALALLPECGLSLPAGSAEARGTCAAAAQGVPAIDARLHAVDGQATGLRLSAPGGEVFDPLAGQSVLRAQVLCSELTLVASASTQVYRVSAPGKRDFVYLEARDTVDGGGASYTLALKPFAPGGECATIASETQFFDGAATATALPATPEPASPFGN